MEHRCSRRKPAGFKVVFYQDERPVQSGIAQNMSMGGLFVDVNTQYWRRYEAFDIELSNMHGETLRMPAVIMHRGDQGVGMMFEDVEPVLEQQYRDMFYETESICA
ncbi:MAG: PilZ domain-containing protein [Gammaproteobacteria bacterium]